MSVVLSGKASIPIQHGRSAKRFTCSKADLCSESHPTMVTGQRVTPNAVQRDAGCGALLVQNRCP